MSWWRNWTIPKNWTVILVAHTHPNQKAISPQGRLQREVTEGTSICNKYEHLFNPNLSDARSAIGQLQFFTELEPIAPDRQYYKRKFCLSFCKLSHTVRFQSEDKNCFLHLPEQQPEAHNELTVTATLTSFNPSFLVVIKPSKRKENPTPLLLTLSSFLNATLKYFHFMFRNWIPTTLK